MPDAPKRTISAKLILSDIRAGMPESEIKRKFGLSDNGYQSVVRKLTGLGMLKGSDLAAGVPAAGKKTDYGDREVQVAWRCQTCGTAYTRVHEECPGCGIIASKAAGMYSRGHRTLRPHQPEAGEAQDGLSSRWPVIVVSIVVFLVVGGIILKWSAPGRMHGKTGTSLTGMGGIVAFTKSNFQREVSDASKTLPVLIMFYADW